MCGIAGYAITSGASHRLEDRSVLERMTAALTHRGPDACGYHLTDHVALGHRRLSIIDLAGGAQPMHYTPEPPEGGGGGLSVVFNGEIYNYRELNLELAGMGFRARTRSDTETILLAYAAWGPRCVERFNGMFAFVIHDRRKQVLFGARDRMGKKPFYYAHLPTKNLFVFGSEAKALLQHPAVSREMDFEAAVRYLVFEHVPAPYAIFKGMRKLTPGQRFTYDLNSGALQLDNYWDPPFGAELAPHGRDITRDEGYWVSQVRQGLESAVQRRLVSDVPLGVFLSGGVDSSAVTAMMVKLQGAANVKTFSIGFSDPTFDESPRARALAKHLGTQHHEEILDPHAALDVLPDVGDMLDEPFADPSILPTYLLARFTRRHVTVALSGDGGDELFAGYHTFQALRAARLYNAFIPGFIDRGVVRPLARRLPVGHGYFAFDFKVKQFLRGVKCDESQRLWRWLGAFVPGELAQVLTPEALSAGNLEQVYDQVRRYHERVATHDAVVRDSYLYAKTYLPEEVLVKVDRATMACSLEARAPLLDTDLVELAARIPSRFKVRGVRGQRLKWIFKEALRGLVPDEILDQSKRGFGVPVGAWFRNELKDVLRDTLHPRRIREAGLVRPEAVQRLIDEHLAGKADHRKPLFTLFMFERWRQKWGK